MAEQKNNDSHFALPPGMKLAMAALACFLVIKVAYKLNHQWDHAGAGSKQAQQQQETKTSSIEAIDQYAQAIARGEKTDDANFDSTLGTYQVKMTWDRADKAYSMNIVNTDLSSCLHVVELFADDPHHAVSVNTDASVKFTPQDREQASKKCVSGNNDVLVIYHSM